MNSIHALRVYYIGAVPVFDDPARGIVAEAFVAGADKILAEVAREYGLPPRSQFTLVFSDSPWPVKRLHKLEWQREEMGGNVYRYYEFGEGWLCQTLLKYFDKPPKTIYFSVKE